MAYQEANRSINGVVDFGTIFSNFELQIHKKTMKKGRFLLLVGFFAVGNLALAQDYTFRVLANKGANEIKSGAAWQPVKTGSTLNVSDEIRISENASIGLVHKSGKPLEEKRPGVYKVTELVARIQGEASVLNKYTDFILSSNSAEAKKNRLSATGAVHRGFGIHFYLPENQFAHVFGQSVTIAWQEEKQGPFVVTFTNMFDEVLKKVETASHELTLDLSDPKLSEESAILIGIISKSTGEKEYRSYLIKKISVNEQSKISAGYNEITREVSSDTEMGKLILAGYFEQNKYIIDAVSTYRQLIKMAPDNPTYKEYYDDFILRNGLKVIEAK
jgi:hypothetical protein